MLLLPVLLLSVFGQTIKRSKCMREYIKSRPDEVGDKTKRHDEHDGWRGVVGQCAGGS